MRPVKNKMGRDPCCDKDSVKRGPWSAEEDAKLKEYIEKNGTGGNWIAFPQRAGLGRCEKSCRLRWLNYLRPNIKHGNFSEEEDRIICNLYASIGSRWSIIAARLPGRTDNDIKNYWNTKLKKKIMAMDMGSTITAHKNSYPHQTIFSSLLQTASSTTSSSCFSSYLSYNCNSHTYESMQTANSITGLEQLLNSTSCLLGNMSSPTTANSAINSQETFKSPVQGHLVKGSALKGEASCSSSDGSTINNSDEVSHGKEPEYEFRNGAETDTIQKYICSDGVQDTQKSMAPNCGNLDGKDNKSTESWQDNYPFDFGLEDIKQLISTSSCNSSFLYDDHNMD